jgi:hypothetical protein
MICGMPGQFNTGNLLNLFFTLTVMAIFLLGCTFKQDGSVDTSKSGEWSVELREEEHKTIKHPNKKTYATIQTDGLQVSFQSDEVHFPSYTFAHKEFHLGEPVFLSSPGSKDLLPMRVVLIKRSEDPKDYHVYRIEWLDKAPATSDGTRIIRY